jgi:hypothetical protein
MTEYVDFSFYNEQFHGTKIEEKKFLQASLRASVFIKYITFGRVSDSFESDYPKYVDDIKMATCAVADVFYLSDKRKQQHDGREVLSEHNDGYIVSFADVETTGNYFEEQQAMRAAYPYLIHTGLLYRGVVHHDDEC